MFQHGEDDDRNVGERTCHLKCATGVTCGRTFPTLQQLNVHQVRKNDCEHGHSNLAAQRTTSNLCPFCMLVMACINTCRNHVKSALQQDCCPSDVTHTVHDLITGDVFKCKMCDETFQRHVDLQIHVRTHVDRVPSFVEFAIPRDPYSFALSARLRTEFHRRLATRGLRTGQ